jgi:Spy/CpxP family protein refolding chaperone
LLVLAALIVGVLIGVAGDHLFLIHRHELFRREFEPHRIADRLDRELHLTPLQKSEIQRILDTHHQRMHDIMSNARPRMRQEIEAGNAEIEKILTPEQRVQFQHLKMRMPPGRGGQRGEPR